MNAVYKCTKCKRQAKINTRQAKCECGGLWKLEYELPQFDDSLIDHKLPV